MESREFLIMKFPPLPLFLYNQTKFALSLFYQFIILSHQKIKKIGDLGLQLDGKRECAYKNMKFIQAIKSGDSTRAKSLIKDDPALVAARDEQGVSAVQWVIYSAQKEIQDELVKRKRELDIFLGA